ncbi:hypothetical protein BCV70DRAFT_197935 [Testicularia cyperi]|uniref:Maintenance of mitochondrial morphology protein 1 n=1 Tax=Testicularia cyperi TaxID=1882483 RepID=A0A317Y0S3_9BASI|nr:hypothetical protein BCV70DRAFT_197935 [Testicularia cyperi]
MSSWSYSGESASAAAVAAAAAADMGTNQPFPHQVSFITPASRWTFTQGLIVGQISMVIIALLLIRYVIFEDSATALEKERLMRLKISERRSKRHAKALLEDARRATAVSGGKIQPGASSRDKKGARAATFASILERTGYDISSHLAESTDWLNVMFAQAIAGYREDVLAGGVSLHPATHSHPSAGGAAGASARHHPGLHYSSLAADAAATADHIADMAPEKERTARDLMEEILNRATSSFLDPIRVTEADFGDAYPIFTNARVRPADDTGRTRIEIDVDYSDQITLAIDTKLLVNFPKPRFAVLPVSLSLTIVRFSGTLAIELFSSDPNATVLPTSAAGTTAGSSRRSTAKSAASTAPRSRHQLHFSLHPDFALEASATSLLGSRAKLQDIPKIEQLLISRLRGWILDRFVWPRYWSLTLPNLVPSPSAANAGAGSDAAHDKTENGTADTRGQQADGSEMKVDTGIEATDGSVIEPGHTVSIRQEMLRKGGRSGSDADAAAGGGGGGGGAGMGSKRPTALSSSMGVNGNGTGAGAGAGAGVGMAGIRSPIGSVEAWRAHTAGAYSHPAPGMLRNVHSGLGGGNNSASGSDSNAELPGGFSRSALVTGVGLGAQSSHSHIRSRPGYVP